MKVFVIVGLVLMVWSAQCDNDAKPYAWGNSTNGVRLGVQVATSDAFGKKSVPYCMLYLQNISTNFFYFRASRHYKLDLRGADGLPVPKAGHRPMITNNRKGSLSPQGVTQLDGFSLSDVFRLQTHGNYKLTVTVLVSTNLRGTFFVLPSATNSFEHQFSTEYRY
jgi:hypothetical protein